MSAALKNDGFNKAGKIEEKCCCRTCPGADSSPLVMAEKWVCAQGDRADGLPSAYGTGTCFKSARDPCTDKSKHVRGKGQSLHCASGAASVTKTFSVSVQCLLFWHGSTMVLKSGALQRQSEI